MPAQTISIYGAEVYRFFDSSGRLLYVGMGGSAHSRWLEHRRTKPWWTYVDHSRTTVQRYESRPEAAAAEARAIREELPQHNIHGTPRHGATFITPPNPNGFGDHRVVGAAEIRDGLGVSRQRVQQLISRPDFPKPYDTLSMGKVWLREDIERWAQQRQMRLTGGAEDEGE
jgi:predicted DNA-binding transcriptional regulator AlpA